MSRAERITLAVALVGQVTLACGETVDPPPAAGGTGGAGSGGAAAGSSGAGAGGAAAGSSGAGAGGAAAGNAGTGGDGTAGSGPIYGVSPPPLDVHSVATLGDEARGNR